MSQQQPATHHLVVGMPMVWFIARIRPFEPRFRLIVREVCVMRTMRMHVMSCRQTFLGFL